MSIEHRQKISRALKGKPHSETHNKRVGDALRGDKNYMYGKHHTPEHCKAVSEAQKGRKFSLIDRIKLSAGLQHIPLNEWKGFNHPEQLRFRGSKEYREWKKAVIKRDNYQCQSCGKRGGKLHGHHIKDFSAYPELRLEVSNGITLCKPCHDAIHKGRPKLRSVEMLKQNRTAGEGEVMICQ
jgi:5-methylcytosine-specific restriction endonuclease McrA